jgi:hypothetical protein
MFGKNEESSINKVNPFHASPNDTPQVVYTITEALALWVLPALFLITCLWMLFSQVVRPPLFSFFCAYGALGAASLGVLTANSLTSIVGFFIAVIISPILLVHNWFALRRSASNSTCHRIAQWASLLSLLILIFFIVWSP